MRLPHDSWTRWNAGARDRVAVRSSTGIVTSPKLIMTRLSGRELRRPPEGADRSRPVDRASRRAAPRAAVGAGVAVRSVRILLGMAGTLLVSDGFVRDVSMLI